MKKAKKIQYLKVAENYQSLDFNVQSTRVNPISQAWLTVLVLVVCNVVFYPCASTYGGQHTVHLSVLRYFERYRTVRTERYRKEYRKWHGMQGCLLRLHEMI